LAARMIHDGHFGRALTVLAEVDTDDPGLDRARFYTLRGLSHSEQKDYQKARADFSLAIKAGQKDPAVRVYLAQACFALDDFEGTLTALKSADKAAREQPAVLLMRAEAAWNLGRKQLAMDALSLGAKRFPARVEFQRLQIFRLIEMGLYQAAVGVSDRYLKRSETSAADYVAVGEALRAANAYRRAQQVMELARLRFPKDENVVVQLAHSYLADGRKFTSAMLFEEASRLNPKYTFEAAELYKEAGLLHRAMWLNSRVADQSAKSKQRLSLLLEGQEYEAIVSMEPKLSRLGLLSDASIRYAVAYSLYKTGRLEQAEGQLKAITDPEHFESALQLRKAIASCAEAGWECAP
jgi:Flp pilus assembly protein TadD